MRQLDAGRDIALRSNEDIESTDTVYAAGDIDVQALGAVSVESGMVAARNRVTINASRFENSGIIFAGLNEDGGVNSHGEVSIRTRDLLNSGEIVSSDVLSTSSDNLVNQGLFNASSQLNLSADNLENQATLFSGRNMGLYIRDGLLNASDSTIFSINDMILAADDIGGKTNQITNELGVIQSLQGDIDIYASRFDNLGIAELRYDMIYYDLGNGREVSNPGSAMNIDLAYSSGYTKHNSKARRRWVNEVLERLARQAPLLYLDNASEIRNNRSARFLAIETQLIDNSITTPAYLDSGNDLNLHVDEFNNRNSVTAATGDINFEITQSYSNQAISATENVVDYQYYTRAKHKSNWKDEDKYTSVDRSGYIPLARAKTVTTNTVTQAGGNINGQIGGQVVNSGVLAGQYQPSKAIDPTIYDGSNLAVPNGDFGLFVKATDPDSKYLIETNPRFADFGNFISSSYLLDRLDYSHSDTLKRLGDAFYESKLIRDRIFSLSGRRYLDSSIQDDNRQFQHLMDNALIAQQALELAPGVALNKDQINRLTRDIVWLEQMEVDGEMVLVPTVYLANGPRPGLRGGRIIAGGDTKLQIAALTNRGLIETGGDLEIDASERIENRGVLDSEHSLNLLAENNIENISGRIEGADVKMSSLKGDIINRRNTESYSYSADELSLESSYVDGAGVIHADNSIELDAAGKVLVEGSEISAGRVSIDASGVEVTTTSKTEDYSSGDRNNFVKESSTMHFASSIDGENIVVLSTGTARVRGSSMNASNELQVLAGDITIDAVNDSEYYASLATDKKSFSETVSSKKSFRSTNIGSELNAATVVLITAHGDIELSGSDITAGSRLVMNSAGDIRVNTGYEGRLDESHKQKSAWFSGGSLYSEKEDLEGKVKQIAVRSEVSATNVELEAIGDIELTGVNLSVNDSLTASARDISVRNASSEDTYYSKHTEISVGFGDLLSNLSDIDDFVQQEDGKLKLKLADASYDHAKTVTTETSVVASQIEAGSIQLNAGNDLAGDILIEGSDLYAEEAIELNASGDVALLDAEHILATEHLTQTGTAELSLTLRNEYEQVSRAIKAVKQAERDLRHAEKDYDRYKQETMAQEAEFERLQAKFSAGEGYIEQTDIDDFERHLDRLKDDKEFYETNIALAAVTLTSKTTALIQQTGRAASSSATYGFNIGLELDIEALERQVDEHYRQSRASSLAARQIEINAGKTALLRGSNLQAEDDIDISANNIEILAGANTTSNSERQRHLSYNYSWDMLGASSSQDPDLLGGSIAGDGSRTDHDATRHVNSQLLAENIRLTAGSDIAIKGADIHAGESLDIKTESLDLASVLDTSYSKTRSQGLSHSGAGGGINATAGEGETAQTLITRLTGRQVNISVAQHSEIQGAVVASLDEDGKDNGQLSFSTNTLNASSLNNTSDDSSRSIGISGGEFSSLDYQNDTESEKTKTLATLGSGNIRISDLDASDIRLLNTDITNTEVSIYDIESHQGLSGELDTRLFTEDGRKQIAEDWLKTEMISNTIKLVATTDRVSIKNYFDETAKSYETYEAVKGQIKTNPELAAMLQHPGLTPQQKQLMLDQITGAVMIELGYVAYDNLVIATDATAPNGDKFFGFYSEQNHNAYINDTENGNTAELITTAGHEAIHAMDDQS
ncbi:MAG: hypothetical protein GY896_17585, partial [Gammaproteobacteria bacterium]|nr:hypothetical protein [Gammaproteobacteria bacterium]